MCILWVKIATGFSLENNFWDFWATLKSGVHNWRLLHQMASAQNAPVREEPRCGKEAAQRWQTIQGWRFAGAPAETNFKGQNFRAHILELQGWRFLRCWSLFLCNHPPHLPSYRLIWALGSDWSQTVSLRSISIATWWDEQQKLSFKKWSQSGNNSNPSLLWRHLQPSGAGGRTAFHSHN